MGTKANLFETHIPYTQMQQKVARSLQKGIREGAVSSLSGSLTETYIPQFALALKATPTHIGILAAIPSLLAPWAQLLGDKLMQYYSRKHIVAITAYIQALFFFPIAVLGIALNQGIFAEHALLILIVSYTLVMSIASIHTPAWVSWMGDLIPQKQRGAYFSKRHRVMGLTNMLLLFGGMALDYYQTQGLALATFSVLFTIAALTRIYSAHLITQQYEPPTKKREGGIPYSLAHFLTQRSAIKRFVLYVALYNLVMYIASPFFAVYMRQDLALSYTWITALSLSSVVFYVCALPYIGTFSDKYGNVRLFYLASVLYALNPLAWLLFTNPWMLLGIQLIGGVANAAYLIGVTNYLLNMVSPNERAIVSTYMNILAGLGIFVGSLLGSLAMAYHPAGLSAIAFTFLLSAIGRLALTCFGINHMREREHVSKLPRNLKPNVFHPLRTLHAELALLKQLKK